MDNTLYDGVDEEEVFQFLDRLRESGAINMFAATQPIVDAFGVDMGRAKGLLIKWMETYSDRHQE